MKEFKKIFRAKTANYWKEVNFFEVHDNKYRLVPKEDTRRGPEIKKLEIDFKKCTKQSKLPQDLQDLMTILVRNLKCYFNNRNVISGEQFHS